MNLKSASRTVISMAAALLFWANLNAQTRTEVIASYNEGAKVMQTDVPAAIKAFENVIILSDKAGESANDLKAKAVQVLPGLYYKAAANAITEKKPGPDVLKAAKLASAKAAQFGNETYKANSAKLLIQAYNYVATGYFTANEFDNAIVMFDSLLQISPDYTNAIYNKALIYVKQNNAASFEQTIDQFIEKSKAANDTTRAKQASKMALEFFRSAGSKANQAEKLDDALASLTTAAKYGDDKDLFYYFADVYNKKKDFNSGAEYAQKGLNLETGTAEAKAKFYYQLAVAQAGKGQTAEACASFRNALYGPFAAASKAQRTNLKCQ